MSYLQTLMRYKQWANDLLYPAINELSEEELAAPRPIVFGSIIRTLNHIYTMDLVWQAHLQDRPHGFTTRNPDSCPSFDKLLIDQGKLDKWYVTYADTLSKSDEDEVVNFTFIGGSESSMCRRDILIHVVNHGTYHRGNVTGMMYECSLEPPTTDYPVFLKRDTPNKRMQSDPAEPRR